MTDVDIRIIGKVGRITLQREQALNALSSAMSLAIETALIDWAGHDAVQAVVIDAAGSKAFCAGGDIAEMYHHGRQGDFSVAWAFWRQEYRLNRRIARYHKPIVTLMQGFVMGGGVGIGSHASIRVVAETARVAMPETAIGLIPDVGGSLLLARAPGAIGEYLALTAGRMDAAGAVDMGFADHIVPQSQWPALIAEIEATGVTATGVTAGVAAEAAARAPSALLGLRPEIDAVFSADSLAEIRDRLARSSAPWASEAAMAIDRHAPLAMACALQLIRAARAENSLTGALTREFRYCNRAMGQGDFLEGIRAMIIDKDRKPKWAHQAITDVTPEDITAMLRPLGEDELNFDEPL